MATVKSLAELQLRSLAAFAMCLLALACSAQPRLNLAVRRAVPTGQGYLASVASADITPPLHLSLFGHGPEGRIATGFRLRLRCQVFVVAVDHEVVALVPCDLQAPSMALQRGVAAKLREIGVPIAADRLFIMATHTHAAPGHYFEARRYSGTFSSRAPGYDERVLKFLVERISAGVAEAFAGLAPACLAWNQTKVFGLTFNRAYVPFLANEPSGDKEDPALMAKRAEQLLQNAEWRTTPSSASETGTTERIPPAAQERDATGAARAIDPELSVLALYRRASAAPACEGASLQGVLAVFGMHPTGIANSNELYHGDIFGFAVRAAEGLLSAPAVGLTQPLEMMASKRQMESSTPDGDRVIVGLVNGVEGDVSPKIDVQSVPDSRKHGRSLGQAIANLTRAIQDPSAEGQLSHLYWDLQFSEGQYDDDPNHKLCKYAELGMAAAGGARDGPTRVRIIPAANAGFQPDRPSQCHDQKVPLRRGVSHSPYDFPQVGPIALIRIGNGMIATVPGEATTMTGTRIRRAIAANASDDIRYLAIAGLTNQYFQYFATHEEYPFQYYEGASTLYGPHSEQFLVRHFGCLAAQLAGKPNRCRASNAVNEPAVLRSHPLPLVERWPEDADLQPFSHAPLQVSKRHREGAAGWEMEIDELPLTFTSDRSEFSVAVLFGTSGDVALDDDRGASIEVRECEDDKWRIRWIPDLVCDDPRCEQPFRLSVRGRVELTSIPFILDCDREPEPCGQ